MTSLAEEDDVSRFISALSNGQHSGTSGSLENSDTMQNGPSDPSEIPNNIANQQPQAPTDPNYNNDQLANDARQVLKLLQASNQ